MQDLNQKLTTKEHGFSLQVVWLVCCVWNIPANFEYII